jgi:hypothetical protein
MQSEISLLSAVVATLAKSARVLMERWNAGIRQKWMISF